MADSAIEAVLMKAAMAGIKQPDIPAAKAPDVAPVVPAETTPPAATQPPAEAPKDIPSFLLPKAPAAKPPEPAATTPPAAGDADKNFANLRKKSEALEAKLKEVFDDKGEVRPEFVSKLNVASPDVDKLRKESEALADRLAAYDLQADPRWQAKYAAQENAAKAVIVRTAKEYGVEQADIDKALHMGLKDRQRFLNEQMPDAVAFVAPHFATLDAIAVSKETDIANAKETHKTVQAQHMTQREAAITKLREGLYSQTVREMDEAGVFLFKSDLGDEKLNGVARGVQETFKKALATNDPTEQARTFALGAAAPALLQSLRLADAEITRLNNELALRSHSSPSMTPAGQQTPHNMDVSKMNHLDIARMAIKNAMGK